MIDTIRFLLYNIMNPDAFFNKYNANRAFDPVGYLNKGKYPDDIQSGIPAEDPRDRNADDPHIETIK